jgi:alpha-N-arabinofuranosidase
MNPHQPNRREMLHATAIAALTLSFSQKIRADETATPAETTISLSPQPQHELSPHLYMQFMEPLGTTDGSIEASWDHLKQRWRPDLVEVTRDMAPPMMRWGGLFSSYYRWREGVGPRAQRKPMHNLVWGGIESNQIGTAEFIDFCKQVGAEPLMCVNFAAEGHAPWVTNALGDARAGDAAEAADWVAYCNDPDNKERIANGQRETLPIKYWQLGNETSFAATRFKKPEAIAKTIEFARAMRKVDPTIKLIAWGDSGWAPDMIKECGDLIDMVAFHHLFDPGPPCNDASFRKNPAVTWDVLMASVDRQEKKIKDIRQQSKTFPLALTESHFSMQGRDRCDLNSTWAVGVAYARFLNLHQRHGDVLKIANLGDFCGTRWQSNVVMLPTPGGKAYVMPVGKVSALYSQHTGKQSITVSGMPKELDVVASRTGDKYFLHVVNTSTNQTQQCRVTIEGVELKKGKAWEITAADPFAEITSSKDDPMTTKTREVNLAMPITFPAASVTVLEMQPDA